MPRLDLDALEAAEKAARRAYPGEWYADSDPESCDEDGDYAAQWIVFGTKFKDDACYVPMDNTGGGMCDASALCSFVVAACNSSIALIARARLAERMAEALKWTLEHHKAALASKPHVATHSISNAEAVLREYDALNIGCELESPDAYFRADYASNRREARRGLVGEPESWENGDET